MIGHQDYRLSVARNLDTSKGNTARDDIGASRVLDPRPVKAVSHAIGDCAYLVAAGKKSGDARIGEPVGVRAKNDPYLRMIAVGRA